MDPEVNKNSFMYIIVVIAILVVGGLIFYSIGNDSTKDTISEKVKLEILESLRGDNPMSLDEKESILKEVNISNTPNNVSAEEKAKILESLKN